MAFSLNTLLDSAGGLLGLGGDPLATPIGRQVHMTHDIALLKDDNLKYHGKHPDLI